MVAMAGYDRKKAESILSEKKGYPVIYTGNKGYTAQFFMIKRTGQLWQQDL